MEDSTTTHDNQAGLTVGAIVGSAALAALVAFFLRRAMRSEEEPTIAKMAADLSDSDMREKAMAATGEFLRAHVAPEVRPMMLSVLRDVREYVDKGFQRAEQSIKEF